MSAKKIIKSEIECKKKTQMQNAKRLKLVISKLILNVKKKKKRQ